MILYWLAARAFPVFTQLIIYVGAWVWLLGAPIARWFGSWVQYRDNRSLRL